MPPTRRSARTGLGSGVPLRIAASGRVLGPALRAAGRVDLERPDLGRLPGPLGAAQEDLHARRAAAVDLAAADARDAHAHLGLLAGLHGVALAAAEAAGAARALRLRLAVAGLRLDGHERDEAGAAAERGLRRAADAERHLAR